MTNHRTLGIGLAVLLTGCVTDGDDMLDVRTAEHIESIGKPLVDRAIGRWVERVMAPPRTLCDSCAVSLVHHITRDNTGVRDEISVRTDDDHELCTLIRHYQGRPIAGFGEHERQAVDYKYLGGTCQWGPQAIAFQEFAMWTGSDDRLEVGEYYDPTTGETAAVSTWVRSPDEPGAPRPNAGLRAVDSQAVATDTENVCDLVPAEGPCADLCDPEALAEHIPEGTCVTFVCHLTDGRRVLTGGCKP